MSISEAGIRLRGAATETARLPGADALSSTPLTRPMTGELEQEARDPGERASCLALSRRSYRGLKPG